MGQLEEPAEAGRLINLIPVGLKEAAIDSPTSRATVQHLGDQVDLLEKWLDDYLKSTTRLVIESGTLESILNNFTSHAVLPTAVSEAMLDHDYSVLAMRKYFEGAKEFWMNMVAVVKKLPALVSEPIKHFQATEIKSFREARRQVEATQKTYDTLHSKFMGLGKYKEPSSLREDAFQLHEARRAYMKAQMDLFQMAPQFRFALDKLMVRLFYEQWKEMKQVRENSSATFQRSSQDMDRVRGWAKEMENSETMFKKELISARKQLEEAAEQSTRPARELEAYSIFTTAGATGHAHTASSSTTISKSPPKPLAKPTEKQGWLYLRTYATKPIRIIWVKRWAFIRHGVFGWLIQDSKGGVEESERIGVLLCAIRPLPAEERRFCFELKTTKNTIGLQAETQAELASWMVVFDAAKEKAIDEPSSNSLTSGAGSLGGPAFAISAPPVPEFGTYILPSTEPYAADESNTLDRSSTLPVTGLDTNDVLRRPTGFADDPRADHTSRIMSKLDLHRRTPTSPQMAPSPTTPVAAGGIASLIAASHGSMPVGPAIPPVRTEDGATPPRRPVFTLPTRDMPPSSLAPSTLANTPTPTSLSKAAVVVAGERGVRGGPALKHGIPNGILANTWGSSNSSFVNRFDRNELRVVSETRPTLQPSPLILPSSSPPKPLTLSRDDTDASSLSNIDLALPPLITSRSRTPSPTKRHRKTISIDNDTLRLGKSDTSTVQYPRNYPLQLKTQDAQFRLLFPNVRREERLAMVFRATWNPSGEQDFPGRAYVTTREMYFYSNHLGLVLTSGISLTAVDEVTAAPGKDCDFLFVHFTEPQWNGSTRITIKTFLEPLRLLQRRLNFLVRNSRSDTPFTLEDIIKTLLKMENEAPERSPSLESWEDVSISTPVDGGAGSRGRAPTNASEFKTPVRVDRALHSSVTVDGERINKFKLPAQPVRYTPVGYSKVAVEHEYDVSPKALFHVMFGDRSALWQLLQHEREAKDLKQGPWTHLGEGRLYRDFEFNIPTSNIFGQPYSASVKDYQTIDVVNDHLCYVVTDRRTPWHLPFQSTYRLLSKIVITHVAKRKCKLAIYVRVDWSSHPLLLKSILERHALHDLELDALDLTDLVTDQVRRLGNHSRTKKAVQIFGQVGQSTDVTQLEIDRSALRIEMRRGATKRTFVSLLRQNVASGVQSSISMVLQALLDIFSWLNKTVSANAFILAILAGSVLYNSWFTLRDSYIWYQDRSTTRFMKRLGVTPTAVMSKAIYIADIDHAMSEAGILPRHETSVCYSTFHSDHFLSDLDTPIFDDGAGDSRSLQSRLATQSAKRIQNTRQRLGSYRHDLMVAMRVVNSIEREVVQSEWENWLQGENRRCKAVEPIVSAARNSSAEIGKEGWMAKLQRGAEKSNELKKEKLDEVVSWYDEYCESCKAEYEKMKSP